MFLMKNKNNIIQTDLYYDMFKKYDENIFEGLKIEYIIKIYINFLLQMKSNITYSLYRV